MIQVKDLGIDYIFFRTGYSERIIHDLFIQRLYYDDNRNYVNKYEILVVGHQKDGINFKCSIAQEDREDFEEAEAELDLLDRVDIYKKIEQGISDEEYRVNFVEHPDSRKIYDIITKDLKMKFDGILMKSGDLSHVETFMLNLKEIYFCNTHGYHVSNIYEIQDNDKIFRIAVVECDSESG